MKKSIRRVFGLIGILASIVFSFMGCEAQAAVSISDSKQNDSTLLSESGSIQEGSEDNSSLSESGSMQEGSEDDSSSTEQETLQYTLSQDESYYVVSGIGTVTGKDITIPATFDSLPVKEIAAYAFQTNEEIESVAIPNCVTEIGEGAFMNCRSLTKVVLGEGIRAIRRSAFACAGLESITIPNSVIAIEKHAFWYCRQLASVTIGNRVNTIGNGAFEGCANLRTINIPDSVTEIGECAFNECASLYAVTIGENVKTIKKNAFGGLCQIQNARFVSPDGWTVAWGDETVELASDELANEQTAGMYLRSVYRQCVWTRII